MHNIAAFIQGNNNPSSRFRVLQYIKILKSFNINIDAYGGRVEAYPPQNIVLRPFWGLSRIAHCFPAVLNSYRYDLSLFQRELLSTFITLEPLAKKPRIFDVDDAIWLHKRGALNTKLLSKLCDLIICGNDFLADFFYKYNPNCVVLPTSVDTERFKPLQHNKEQLVIGWSGSSSGFRYLYHIEPALKVIFNKFPQVKLRVIANSRPDFQNIPSDRFEFVIWSPAIEVSSIQDITLGIMPLDDSIWSRGKCGFKMLTYMACGVPVVVSPVGVNKVILNKGSVGLGPHSIDEWIDAISTLLGNPRQCNEMGAVGVQVVHDNYSVKKIAPRLAKLLTHVCV